MSKASAFLIKYMIPPGLMMLRWELRKSFLRTSFTRFFVEFFVPIGLRGDRRLPSFWSWGGSLTPQEIEVSANSDQGTLIVLEPPDRLLQEARVRLLQVVPVGGTVAEVGTFRGDFARQIIDTSKVKELNLIDPWKHQDDLGYPLDLTNVSDGHHEVVFGSVLARFSKEINRGQVILHRGLSHDVVNKFPDEYFDWVYIDANHTFESVLSDLRLFSKKTKEDGFICGDDFDNHINAQKKNFGVVRAVNEFIEETGYRLVALFLDSCSSYVIVKRTDTERFRQFRLALLRFTDPVVEIPAELVSAFQQHRMTFSDGTARVFTSFLTTTERPPN